MEKSFLSEAEWMKGTVPLKRVRERGICTPCIVRVDSNGGESLPSRLTQEPLLLHSIISHTKIISQCVDFVGKDQEIVFSSQRFSIPIGYPGWFEILSEEGKTVAPCKTIDLVVQKGVERFLVRSNVKAFFSDLSGEPNYDKPRSVQKGELMTIVEQLTTTIGWRKQKKQILHCVDSSGIDTYFDCKCTGQFSPLAGTSNISGVHSIEGLVEQFRLPLTVRIVSGQIPRTASENERPGVFRLLEVQKDTTGLFMPTITSQKLLPVSTRMVLNLIICNNMDKMIETDLYQKLVDLAEKKVEKYLQTMQMLVSANQNYDSSTLPSRRKAQLSSAPTRKLRKDSTEEEDALFAEVDDLYAYVRRGGAPPRPRPRSWATAIDVNNLTQAEIKSNSQPMLSTNGKPRGLLATLTAGKFPTKVTPLIRQHKVQSVSPIAATPPKSFNTQALQEKPPTRRYDKVKSYIERYQGSVESLQTEVDPCVDESHYQNFETIETFKKDVQYVGKKIISSVKKEIADPANQYPL